MTLAAASERAVPVREGRRTPNEFVRLPAPSVGVASLDDAMLRRRSVRSFSSRPLTRREIGQLCWAAAGLTGPGDLRTAPSAGAIYPLALHVVHASGVFRYRPRGHVLERVATDDRRMSLVHATRGQEAVRQAGASFVITASLGPMHAKYGERAERYVALEAGHVAQNVLLEATALAIGGVPVGAFDDELVRRVVGVSRDDRPLYVIALGHPVAG